MSAVIGTAGVLSFSGDQPATSSNAKSVTGLSRIPRDGTSVAIKTDDIGHLEHQRSRTYGNETAWKPHRAIDASDSSPRGGATRAFTTSS